MNKAGKIVKDIFSDADGNWSSKRVLGGLGILSCIVMSWYCMLEGIQAPSICEPILYTSGALLGVDSVMKRL